MRGYLGQHHRYRFAFTILARDHETLDLSRPYAKRFFQQVRRKEISRSADLVAGGLVSSAVSLLDRLDACQNDDDDRGRNSCCEVETAADRKANGRDRPDAGRRRQSSNNLAARQDCTRAEKADAWTTCAATCCAASVSEKP